MYIKEIISLEELNLAMRQLPEVHEANIPQIVVLIERTGNPFIVTNTTVFTSSSNTHRLLNHVKIIFDSKRIEYDGRRAWVLNENFLVANKIK